MAHTNIRMFLICFALVVSIAGHAKATNVTALTPGVYDQMMIGYDADTKKVTGYYSDETGAGKFTCIFYLNGVFEKGVAKITTYAPSMQNQDTINGTLAASASDEFRVTLPEEHGGCWNVEHFVDGPTFHHGKPHPWKAVRVVKAERAWFYARPQDEKPRKAYLVESDGVGVKTAANGWLEVDYTSGKKTVTGWMKETDFYPVP